MDGRSSPVSNGFCPHDLNDIYEYKTDHQYFTHTGAYQNNCQDKVVIASEAQRNSLFRNSPMVHSLDENIDLRAQQKHRFDNSSFARQLNSSISQSSVDSGNTSSSSNNSKEKLNSKGNNHQSFQEMIKSFGKKVHIWPRNRHDSINENEISKDRNMSLTPEPMIHPENFRSRSKSLDVTSTSRILDDCESTYKIYNRILKEGKRVLRGR